MLKILYNLFKGVVMIFPYSAGVVIIRYDLGVPKVLFLRTYNHWDFPKGGIEGSENKLQAAIREVEEETGIKDLNFRWGKVLYETEFYGKNHKKVSYFIAETKQKEIIFGINPKTNLIEHEEYRWLTFEEAKKLSVSRIEKVLNWAETRLKFKKQSIG